MRRSALRHLFSDIASWTNTSFIRFSHRYRWWQKQIDRRCSIISLSLYLVQQSWLFNYLAWLLSESRRQVTGGQRRSFVLLSANEKCQLTATNSFLIGLLIWSDGVHPRRKKRATSVSFIVSNFITTNEESRWLTYDIKKKHSSSTFDSSFRLPTSKMKTRHWTLSTESPPPIKVYLIQWSSLS